MKGRSSLLVATYPIADEELEEIALLGRDAPFFLSRGWNVMFQKGRQYVLSAPSSQRRTLRSNPDAIVLKGVAVGGIRVMGELETRQGDQRMALGNQILRICIHRFDTVGNAELGNHCCGQ